MMYLVLGHWKALTISLFNNSEKLVQILLEFIQQIVEGDKFVWAKLRSKRPFQSTQICDLSQSKGWYLWPYFSFWLKFVAVFYVFVQDLIEVSCAKM